MADLAVRLRTLDRAASLVRATPGRRGRLVPLGGASDVVVAGDLHGHVANFQAVVKAAALAANPRRHLVLQEVVHGRLRYPGGGDRSHQLLDLFAALKGQFPERVHLLMGNHEMAQWTNRQVMKDEGDLNELFRAGVREAYGDGASAVYAAYERLFAALAAGGADRERRVLQPQPADGQADPDLRPGPAGARRVDAGRLQPGGLAYSLVWGRDTRAETAEAFLARVGADWLATGHVPCDEGYAWPSGRHLILDSCAAPAAYAVVPADRPLTAADFAATVRLI